MAALSPFWKFLNHVHPRLYYLAEPEIWNDSLLLMPWQADPQAAFMANRTPHLRAVFMHQPVNGAVGEHGMKMKVENTPIFPRSLKVYSGDIHTPQKVGVVEYVGAPHPIDFGDDYPCRMLRLNTEYEIVRAITLHPPKKHMLRVRNLKELEQTKTEPGDQARIEFHVAADRIEQWAVEQEGIAQWAADRKIRVASVETIIDAQTSMGTPQTPIFDADPTETLSAFCTSESLADNIADAGKQLLAEQLELLQGLPF